MRCASVRRWQRGGDTRGRAGAGVRGRSGGVGSDPVAPPGGREKRSPWCRAACSFLAVFGWNHTHLVPTAVFSRAGFDRQAVDRGANNSENLHGAEHPTARLCDAKEAAPRGQESVLQRAEGARPPASSVLRGRSAPCD